MNDYTEVFNQERVKKGLQPTGWTILEIHEGMILPCGCKVHNTSNSHFSVYHSDNCQSQIKPRIGKEIVGQPMTNMIASIIISQTDKIIALTNPTLGLWPYEVNQ